jgi:hypothetical protein
MARRAALICLVARTAAEGGRGHAVASSTWQSTHHDDAAADDDDEGTKRADVLPAPRRRGRGRAAS